MLEGVSAWLCLHSIFGVTINKNYKELIYFITYILFFAMCYLLGMNKVFGLCIFVSSIIWSKHYFEKNINSTIFKVIVSTILLGVIEVISMLLCEAFFKITSDMSVQCVVIGMNSVMLSAMLYWYSLSKTTKHITNNTIKIGILAFFIFLVTLKIDIELNKKVNIVSVVYYLILALGFILLYNKQKSIHLLEKKNLNLELYNMYGKAYEDLLNEVRRKQHDYKNQLAAIASMHITTSDYDELIQKQSKYIDMLKKENKVDSILTKCNNSIIAGYLYTTYIKLKKDNVKLETDICISSDEINTRTKDIIEILGILINNAYEYVKESNFDEKLIYLYIDESLDNVTIKIENISNKILNSQIETMFKEGISTKGRNRGIGLKSLKDIVKKYSGEIYVKNYCKCNQYWTCFKVILTQGA